MRIGLAAIGAAMLALGGCAPGGSAPNIPNGAMAAGTIGADVKSWGHPVFSWSITPTGMIHYAEAVREEGKSFQEYWLVEYSYDAPVSVYSEIAELMAPARDYVDRKITCENRMTDAAYGEARWSGPPAQTLKLDGNCVGKDSDTIFGGVYGAAKRLKEIAAKGTVTRRWVGSPR